MTFARAVTRCFPWVGVAPYVLAQFLGATVGSFLLVAFFGMRAVGRGGGVAALSTGVSYGQGIVTEALSTFVLMLAVMAVAVG